LRMRRVLRATACLSTSAGSPRYFVAAADAANEDKPLWPHERHWDSAPVPCLRTQRRHAYKVAALLGFGIELSSQSAEAVARILGVGLVVYEQARAAYSAARSIRSRSKAVIGLLVLLTVDGSLLYRLLGAGTRSGALGAAYIWDAGIGKRLFPASGTPPPGCGRCRPPPSIEIGSP
jgi:hypothetical protein